MRDRRQRAITVLSSGPAGLNTYALAVVWWRGRTMYPLCALLIVGPKTEFGAKRRIVSIDSFFAATGRAMGTS